MQTRRPQARSWFGAFRVGALSRATALAAVPLLVAALSSGCGTSASQNAAALGDNEAGAPAMCGGQPLGLKPTICALPNPEALKNGLAHTVTFAEDAAKGIEKVELLVGQANLGVDGLKELAAGATSTGAQVCGPTPEPFCVPPAEALSLISPSPSVVALEKHENQINWATEEWNNKPWEAIAGITECGGGGLCSALVSGYLTAKAQGLIPPATPMGSFSCATSSGQTESLPYNKCEVGAEVNAFPYTDGPDINGFKCPPGSNFNGNFPGTVVNACTIVNVAPVAFAASTTVARKGASAQANVTAGAKLTAGSDGSLTVEAGCWIQAPRQDVNAVATDMFTPSGGWSGPQHYSYDSGSQSACVNPANAITLSQDRKTLKVITLIGPSPSVRNSATPQPSGPHGNVAIASGGTLKQGETVKAADGSRVTMQDDGNLVAYDSAGKPTWASNTGAGVTDNEGPYAAAMLSDGILAVYGNSSEWNSGTCDPRRAFALIADGGLFQIWTTGTSELLWQNGKQMHTTAGACLPPEYPTPPRIPKPKPTAANPTNQFPWNNPNWNNNGNF